jgi:hypothetical protein
MARHCHVPAAGPKVNRALALWPGIDRYIGGAGEEILVGIGFL